MVCRKERNEQEKLMMEQIEEEYQKYRSRMLEKAAEEIYGSCMCIHFYEAVYEYFQYRERINPRFVQKAVVGENVLAELWRIYLKYEYLRMETWSDLEEVLNIYIGDV